MPTLSKELQNEFPGVGGFSVGNLWLMAQFYTEYHNVRNLVPLVREISWSKHVAILKSCKDNLERQFYMQATKKFDRFRLHISKKGVSLRHYYPPLLGKIKVAPQLQRGFFE